MFPIIGTSPSYELLAGRRRRMSFTQIDQRSEQILLKRSPFLHRHRPATRSATLTNWSLHAVANDFLFTSDPFPKATRTRSPTRSRTPSSTRSSSRTRARASPPRRCATPASSCSPARSRPTTTWITSRPRATPQAHRLRQHRVRHRLQGLRRARRHDKQSNDIAQGVDRERRPPQHRRRRPGA